MAERQRPVRMPQRKPFTARAATVFVVGDASNATDSDMTRSQQPSSSEPRSPMVPSDHSLSIVHVTTFYPPHTFGGDGVQVQRVAQALARRGHKVSVVYAPGAFSLLSPHSSEEHVDIGHAPAGTPEVAVHPLDDGWGKVEAVLVQQTGRPVLNRGRLESLLEQPDGRPPDVIHYHNVSLVGGLGVLGIGSAVKLYTPHEYWLMCPTHLLFRYNREICTDRTCFRCTLHSGTPPQLWRLAGLRDRFMPSIDAFVFPSHLTESVHRQHGIDRPGLVINHFLPDEYIADAESRGDRPDDVEPYYLYVGRLEPVKGVEALVRHFAEHPCPAPLYLVGDGSLEGPLKEQYGQNPSFRFLGRLGQEDVGELMRDALALILPSAGYEVLGLVVLEAFAHSTPAIVAGIAGATELIAASGAGYTYDTEAELDEALGRLAADPTLRSELGRKGHDYLSEAHGEGSYMRRYEQLVEELRGQ
jgi:glycosyltransferase involved in cell wall biosynthesis